MTAVTASARLDRTRGGDVCAGGLGPKRSRAWPWVARVGAASSSARAASIQPKRFGKSANDIVSSLLKAIPRKHPGLVKR